MLHHFSAAKNYQPRECSAKRSSFPVSDRILALESHLLLFRNSYPYPELDPSFVNSPQPPPRYGLYSHLRLLFFEKRPTTFILDHFRDNKRSIVFILLLLNHWSIRLFLLECSMCVCSDTYTRRCMHTCIDMVI